MVAACGAANIAGMEKVNSRRYLPLAALLAILALVLSACTMTTRVSGSFGLTVPLGGRGIVTLFEPTRGTGGHYWVGDAISFTIHTTRAGYVTLSYLDSRGNSNVFARNIYVNAGRTVISGPAPGLGFMVTEPRGVMYVRASLTAARTNEARVSYFGSGGADGWNSRLAIDVGGHAWYDVAQTWIDVR